MPKDPLQMLLEHLRAEEGTPVPTSSLGRLGKAALTGARVGFGALAGKMRGRDVNLGALSPEALARLVEPTSILDDGSSAQPANTPVIKVIRAR